MNKKHFTITIVIMFLSCIFLNSCSENVKKKKLTDANMEKELQTIKDSKQLTDDEMRMLATYYMRSKLASAFGRVDSSKDKSVGEMIEEERKFEDEQKAKEAEQKHLAEEAAREEAQLADELRKTIIVSVYKKSFSPSNWQSGTFEDYILLGFVFKNESGKNIRGFTGTVLFNDIFDNEIARTTISYDQIIPAGKTVKWNGQRQYNQYIDADKKLATTELSNIKIVWFPEKVLFTDGSKIGKE